MFSRLGKRCIQQQRWGCCGVCCYFQGCQVSFRPSLENHDQTCCLHSMKPTCATWISQYLFESAILLTFTSKYGRLCYLVWRRIIWPDWPDNEKSYLIKSSWWVFWSLYMPSPSFSSIVLKLLIWPGLPSSVLEIGGSFSMSKSSGLCELFASIKMSLTHSASLKGIYLQKRRVLFQATCWTGATGQVRAPIHSVHKVPYKASLHHFAVQQYVGIHQQSNVFSNISHAGEGCEWRQ